jgi:hypothetical protein
MTRARAPHGAELGSFFTGEELPRHMLQKFQPSCVFFVVARVTDRM